MLFVLILLLDNLIWLIEGESEVHLSLDVQSDENGLKLVQLSKVSLKCFKL